MGMGNGCSDVRQSRQIFEYTIENANVLFSYLLGKEAGTYNPDFNTYRIKKVA